MEMILRPNTSLGDEGAMLIHILYNHYNYPKNFCFDRLNCKVELIADNNVEKKS